MNSSTEQSAMIGCNGLNCSFCSFLETIQNIFNWLLGISFAMAVLFIVLAGLAYLSSSGDKKLLERARKIFIYTIYGFAFVLGSFLFINVSFLIIGATNKNTWFQIDCSEGSTFQKTSSPEAETAVAVPNLNFVDAGNLFFSAQNPKTVTDLNVATLTPQTLLQDALALSNGQKISFIGAEKTLNEDEIKKYINKEKGFSVSSSGDRAEGSIIGNIITLRRDEDGISVILEGEEPQILGEINQNSSASDSEKILKNLMGILSEKSSQGNKIYALNDRNQEESFSIDEKSCLESGGEVTVFQNECMARKYTCGEEKILCSSSEKEVMGCQCPLGSCLKDQKCVKVETTADPSLQKDQDNDKVPDDLDRCPNTPKGEKINEDRSSADYGCACSQLSLNQRTCPQSRCEGPNLLTYPSSGKDSCVDGKRIIFYCEPKTQYNPTCQQSFVPNIPSTSQNKGSGGSNPPIDLSSLLGKGGSGSGSSGGGSGSGGGNGGGGGGTNPTGGNGNTSSPSSPLPPSQNTSLTPQEAFEGGNGSEKDPFAMSDRAIQEVFSYNEDTGKIDLNEKWQSKLGVCGKEAYLKIPEKKKIIDALNKKKDDKNSSDNKSKDSSTDNTSKDKPSDSSDSSSSSSDNNSPTDKSSDNSNKEKISKENADRLEKDKDAIKAPNGTDVVDKKSNKTTTVDKNSDGNDPSKTKDDSLNPDDQLLKSSSKGCGINSDYVPKNSKESKALEKGLVKAADDTFTTKNNGASDFFTPEIAEKLAKASQIARDEYGLGLNLTSGYRSYEEQAWLWANRSGVPVAPPGSSRHETGEAVDVSLVNLDGSRISMNGECRAALRDIMVKGGLRPLNSEWWHFSRDGH